MDPHVATPLGRGVTTVEELMNAVGEHPDLNAFQLVERGDGFVEFSFPSGSAVFLWPEVWQDHARTSRHLVRALAGYSPIVLLGTDEHFRHEGLANLREAADIALELLPLGRERLSMRLHAFNDACEVRRAAEEGKVLTGRYRYELDELTAIGRALASQRDIRTLLDLILNKSRDVTGADAGSVYVVEGDKDDPATHRIRFKVSQNDSIQLDFTEFTLPVSYESIVGHVVLTGAPVNIPDMYAMKPDPDGPYRFRHNRDFDDKIGYQTRSLLTLPLVTAQGQVIGVIQLINKKRRVDAVLVNAEHFDGEVIGFDQRSQEIAHTLAAQAAIALENAQLYVEIQNLFESFVRASVSAIESRDPTTSGHSQRVADLTVGLAKATDLETAGVYSDYRITERELKTVEYAALLHDFGKVGVRENVLVKAKKLYEHDRELVMARFDFIKRSLESESHRRKTQALLEMSREAALEQFGHLDSDLDARLRELDDFLGFILRANEPTVLDQGGFERLTDIAQHRYRDLRGNELPYLTSDEVATLGVLRGSLTEAERREIENHVTHTYNFLKMIPWGRDFKGLAEIAGTHHEKLDGTGYPRRLTKDQIPTPAKMMTIADIYDALTASDRPYKKAMPTTRALDILHLEVKAGKCDAELFRIFTQAEIYKLSLTGG